MGAAEATACDPPTMALRRAAGNGRVAPAGLLPSTSSNARAPGEPMTSRSKPSAFAFAVLLLASLVAGCTDGTKTGTTPSPETTLPPPTETVGGAAMALGEPTD